MKLEDAIVADRSGDLPLAAARYERVIESGDVSLECLLNLAILYWQATDFGMAAARKLSRDFLQTAAQRLPELLSKAAHLYPESSEPVFWKRYIAWADLGEEFTEEECRQLLKNDPTSLVPAMNLFGASEGAEAQSEAMELLRQCEEDATTRANYVSSVIRGVLTRTKRRL